MEIDLIAIIALFIIVIFFGAGLIYGYVVKLKPMSNSVAEPEDKNNTNQEPVFKQERTEKNAISFTDTLSNRGVTRVTKHRDQSFQQLSNQPYSRGYSMAVITTNLKSWNYNEENDPIDPQCAKVGKSYYINTAAKSYTDIIQDDDSSNKRTDENAGVMETND